MPKANEPLSARLALSRGGRKGAGCSLASLTKHIGPGCVRSVQTSEVRRDRRAGRLLGRTAVLDTRE
jgi:hypothetical protein